MSGEALLSKTLKAVHIALASGIIGGLAAILVLLGVKAAVDPAAYAPLDRGVLAIFCSAVVLAVVVLGIAGCRSKTSAPRESPMGPTRASPRSVIFTYRVRVEVSDGRIIRITVPESRCSEYAEYAQGVFSKIIDDQTPNTDAITGATTTSKAYMKAVEDALRRALGLPASENQ